MKTWFRLISFCLVLCLPVLAQQSPTNPAPPPVPAKPSQDPFKLSPSVGLGVTRSWGEKYFSATPGLGLGTTVKTSSGYDLKLSTAWGFDFKEYLMEEPLASTEDIRDFKNTFSGGITTSITDMISVSAKGKVVIYRSNAYEWSTAIPVADSNAYRGELSTALSVIENGSVSFKLAFTAVDWLNVELGADPVAEGAATGSGVLDYIGDRSVVSRSMFAEGPWGGYSGSSVFVQAAQVAPATGSVGDYTTDIGTSVEYKLPDETSLNGGYTLSKRLSDEIRRDKWGNTFVLGAGKSLWEDGSTNAGYVLSITNFDNIEADDVYFRRDFYHEVSVSAGQTISENISVESGFIWFLNFSNMDGKNFNENEIYLSLSSSF